MVSTDLAWLIRRHVIEMTNLSHASHVGSCLSAADIIAVLYADIMRYDAENPVWEGRDRFVMSKGHAAAAVYAALAECGFIRREELLTHCGDGSRLFGHVSHLIPGIECSTGSLGHGFPMAAGMAFAAKKDGADIRVYAVLGDGECNEGTIWETAMFSAAHGLDNLTAVVDRNRLQGLGRCDKMAGPSPVADKWRGFGWNALEVDGHDHGALKEAFFSCRAEKPAVVIADTIKGYPVDFMEDSILWHYRFPHDGEEYDGALRILAAIKPAGIQDPYQER